MWDLSGLYWVLGLVCNVRVWPFQVKLTFWDLSGLYWVLGLVIIVTFPGHTHLLVGTYQGDIGCLGWYALFDSGVSGPYSHTIWVLSALYRVLGLIYTA